MIKKILKQLQDFIGKNNFSGVVIAIISFLAIILFSATEMYEVFESRFYDLRFGMKPSVEEWEFLTFLNVDERSINNVGEYPWPRNIYARGLDVLKEVGVRQSAFDFEFIDDSANTINTGFLNELYRKIESNTGIGMDDLSNLIIDHDKIFAGSIKQLNGVALPFHFYEYVEEIKEMADVSVDNKRKMREAKEIFYKKSSVKLSKEDREAFSCFTDSDKVGIALPIPELVKSAYAFGYTDRDPDIDGTERKIRLIRVYEDRLFFQMGLVMLMDICGVKKEDVLVEPGNRIVLKGAVNPLTHQQKDISIPIDEKGMIFINWAGPGRLEESFQHLSFYALLEYPQVQMEIHDYFDEKDKETGKWELSKLYSRLDEIRNEYYKSKNLSLKREKWASIVEIRGEIRNLTHRYAKPIVDEIKRLKEELKEGGGPELKSTLFGLENYKKAIDIVLQVERLQDNLTIIGLTATGTQDLGVIPIHNEYMMVGTYINVVNTILNESFIMKVGEYTNYIIMFLLSIFMGIILQRIDARMSLLVIISAIIAVNILNIGLFVLYNIWFGQLGSNLSVLMPSIIIAGIKFMDEENKRRYIKNAFSRYIAPGVIDQIIESPDALELGGENREITIFFSDVAKFSTISEKLTPPQLVDLLNEYLSEMTDIILSYGGTVDKYEGDAIMAFYGAPLSQEDHALKCCMASIDMKKRLREMQEEWRKLGKDELKVRMGMNTGEAVVGNMGSRTRMDYTAMGDSVNLASRLEGVNKIYSTNALISETTYEMVKDHVEARKLDIVRVVGKTEAIVIYELLNKKGALPDRMFEMLEKYYKGLENFQNREWKKALEFFKQGLEIIDDDGPCLTYCERCDKFMKREPSVKWDGVFTLKSK